jgi:chromatin segregation and condensation protein Rec8/ScpA/Scc1 (kleisin family)
MNCEKYTELIEKYLSAEIKETELEQLKGHIGECESCRKKYERLDKLENIVKESFSSATSAEQASEAILSKLPATGYSSARIISFNKWSAIAASVLVGISFLCGFIVSRIDDKRISIPMTAKVPMKVAKLEGTVLVKHENSELWLPLSCESEIYVGDTFHSAAKSSFVLELENQSTLELNQNSMLVLKLYNGETQFYLEHGKLAAALESPHPPFFVSTPHGRVEALGTEFTVNVE